MIGSIPDNQTKFRKEWPKFEAWLVSRGSEIRPPSNRYEVARFTTPEGVGVIYQNGKGIITSAIGGAEEAWGAWKKNAEWRAVECVSRQSRQRRNRIAALVERDGDACFFCGQPLGDDITIEHLVPIAHGGTNHQSNLALAHEACNQRADHLSVAGKVRLRDEMRRQTEEVAA